MKSRRPLRQLAKRSFLRAAVFGPRRFPVREDDDIMELPRAVKYFFRRPIIFLKNQIIIFSLAAFIAAAILGGIFYFQGKNGVEIIIPAGTPAVSPAAGEKSGTAGKRVWEIGEADLKEVIKSGPKMSGSGITRSEDLYNFARELGYENFAGSRIVAVPAGATSAVAVLSSAEKENVYFVSGFRDDRYLAFLAKFDELGDFRSVSIFDRKISVSFPLSPETGEISSKKTSPGLSLGPLVRKVFARMDIAALPEEIPSFPNVGETYGVDELARTDRHCLIDRVRSAIKETMSSDDCENCARDPNSEGCEQCHLEVIDNVEGAFHDSIKAKECAAAGGYDLMTVEVAPDPYFPAALRPFAVNVVVYNLANTLIPFFEAQYEISKVLRDGSLSLVKSGTSAQEYCAFGVPCEGRITFSEGLDIGKYKISYRVTEVYGQPSLTEKARGESHSGLPAAETDIGNNLAVASFEVKENTPPSAQILTISPAVGQEGEPLELEGRGRDADGDIKESYWYSRSAGRFCVRQHASKSEIVNFCRISGLEPGEHQINFSVRDPVNIISSETRIVRINKKPLVGAGEDRTVKTGQSVLFRGFAEDPDGRIVKCQWDFDGDGVYDWASTSYGITSHVFKKAGKYRAALTATDNDGGKASDSATITVVAANKPQASVVKAQYRTYKGDPLVLEAKGTDFDGYIQKYEWDFDGDDTYDWSSEITNWGAEVIGRATRIYDKEGAFYPRLKVTDNEWLTGETEKNAIRVDVTCLPPDVRVRCDSCARDLGGGNYYEAYRGRDLVINASGSSAKEGRTLKNYVWSWWIPGVNEEQELGSSRSSIYTVAASHPVLNDQEKNEISVGVSIVDDRNCSGTAGFRLKLI